MQGPKPRIIYLFSSPYLTYTTLLLAKTVHKITLFTSKDHLEPPQSPLRLETNSPNLILFSPDNEKHDPSEPRYGYGGPQSYLCIHKISTLPGFLPSLKPPLPPRYQIIISTNSLPSFLAPPFSVWNEKSTYYIQ